MVNTQNSAAKIVDAAVSRFGRIDLLVNNAGLYFSKPFTDYTLDDLRSLMSVNIEGFLFVTPLAISAQSAERRRRRIETPAEDFWRGQESLPVGVWRCQPASWCAGRARDYFRDCEVRPSSR